jgi:SAM-dependent methyltransferase
MTDEGIEPIRAGVHGMWAAVAPQWGEHADQVDDRGADQTARLLDAVEVSPGDRLLELAGGPGGVGLAAAERVGPEGEVVLSDVAEAMATVAGQRAAARRLTNVSTAVLDLEAIDQPDESFDAVVCREGLMFALDPARALGEIHRVLRPDGRTALSVWGLRSANPWLGELLDATSTVLDTPMPPPGIPGPFSLADVDLDALLSEAGFVDVLVDEVPVPHRTGSFEEYWGLTTDLAGPLAMILGAFDDDVIGPIRDRTRAALEPYFTADGLEIPGVTRLASGRRR